MDKTLQSYYSKRAQEYEAIYHRDDPVRKKELAQIGQLLRELYKNRRVLEVACGTGYWTEVLASVASHVLAIDFSQEVLEVARRKPTLKSVALLRDDAYELSQVSGSFDGGVANFWFSHVPKRRIEEFMETFHGKLRSGAVVFMCDNVLVPGLGGELIIKPGQEDTFKLRTLSDGTTYEVLKNYYSLSELKKIFAPVSRELNIEMSGNYWRVCYKLP